MDNACQTCGDTGFTELLTYCSKCGTAPEHRYCLVRFPHRDEEVYRLCEQCTNESIETVPTEKLPLLAGGDIGNVEYVDGNLNCSNGIPGLQDHIQQIPITETVSVQESKRGPTSFPLHAVTEDEVCGHASLKQKVNRKRKKRRLIMDDDDDDDEELGSGVQTDCVGQITPVMTPRSPTGSSVPAVLAPVRKSSSENAPDEVMNRLQIVCTETGGHQPTETNGAQLFSAQPIIDYVWRGCFSIGDEEYGPLYGHLSSKACEKVYNLSELLPTVLYLQKLPRLDAWPNTFKTVPPTDENIALYFFPEYASVSAVFYQLLGEVVSKDLVLKFVFDKVELLVFSATVLPKDHQKFQGEYYLWGVFRPVQDPLPALMSQCSSKSNDVAQQNLTADVSLTEEKEAEVDGCDEVFSDVTQSCSPCTDNAPQASQCNKHTEKTQNPNSSTPSADKEREGSPVVDESCREELEEGEICDEYYNISENVDGMRDDEAPCLELFPLQVEDIGIVGRVGAVDKLNLDLGLGCKFAISKGHCEDKTNTGSKLIMGRFL